MKVAQPRINLFTLPEATEPKPGLPPTAASIGNPLPLTSVLANGSTIDLSKYAAHLGIQQLTRRPLPVLTLDGLTSMPKLQSTSATASANASAPLPEKPAWELKGAAVAAWPWVQKTSPLAVVKITEGMSQTQITHLLTSVPGVPQQQANTVAEVLIQALHSHGGHALMFGITLGGLGGGIATFLGYKQYAGYAAAALLALGVILYLIFGREPNPYIGKWTMQEMDTVYESGTPPRQAVEEIAGGNDALKIVRSNVEEGGQRDRLTETLIPDGKSHPSTYPGADSVVTTRNKNTLLSTYSKDGQTVATETRTLSADQKQLTVTTLGHTSAGAAFKNVMILEKSE